MPFVRLPHVRFVTVCILFWSACPPVSRAVDCNSNGVEDSCDIDCGTPGGACDVPGCGSRSDCNSNTIPDGCEDLAILLVDDDAPIGGDGATWSTAYRDVQEALSAAACLTDAGSPSVEIRVAGGTYRPSARTNPADPRSATFTLLNNVSLQGGYRGLSAGGNPDDRDDFSDPANPQFQTVLSGDLNDDDANPPGFMPMGYWPLESQDAGVTLDQSGNNLHGTLADGAQIRPGRIGNAVWFDTAGAYVSIGPDPILNSNSAFTIAFWVNGDGAQGATLIDKSHGASNGVAGWAVQSVTGTGTLRLALGTTLAGFPETDLPGALDNSWHHVCYTVSLDPLRVRAYRDGALVNDSTLTGAGSFVNNEGAFLFGKHFELVGREYIGALDEVALFSRSLSDLEVLELAHPFGDNSYHVLKANGSGSDGILDGFTITGGNANGDTTNWSCLGGGLQIESASPTVRNCAFVGNRGGNPGVCGGGGGVSLLAGGSPQFLNCTFRNNTAPGTCAGGGLWLNSNSSPIVRGCSFTDNTAYQGGGMYVYTTHPIVEDCTFNGNIATGDAGSRGGGVFNSANSQPVFTRCGFTGNSAPVSSFGGGAMANDLGSDSILTTCTFINNSAATGGGGAIHNDNAGSPTLTECTFLGNSANKGGAVYILSSSPTFTNCTLLGNTSVSVGGGMLNNNSSTTLANCLFSGNTSGSSGGGLYNTNADPTLLNCTFLANSSSAGGGMNNASGSEPTIINCIFWRNSGGIYPQIDNNSDGQAHGFASFSNVQRGLPPETADAGGNIDADPLFVDPDGADNIIGTEDDAPQLLPGSPSVDAGDNSRVPVDVTTDLAGDPRFVDVACASDSGNGASPIVDMGAYELAAMSPEHDCNNNCVLDRIDVFCRASIDCNNNEIPDECEADCDGDAVPDDCEPDCNTNGIADPCDIVAGTVGDVNANGVPDGCEDLLDYNIGEISPQSTWHDQVLQFLVHSDDLGAGATFSIEAAPQPFGAIVISASTGLFTYTPDIQDTHEFTVTFTAQLGSASVSQGVLLEPLPNLPDEQAVFGLVPGTPLPDPEAREYIVRNEILRNAPELFNTQTRPTRDVSIAGKTIVLQASHSNALYDSYNENDDLKTMTISAETVIIRSPLRLPQTAVTIHARTLRMEDPPGMPGNAHIDTTPRSLTTRPAQFQNGIFGHDAGDITLHVQSFSIQQEAACGPSGQPVRFILNAGNGQPAGLGSDGTNGASKPGICGIPLTTCGTLNCNDSDFSFCLNGGFTPTYFEERRSIPGCFGPVLCTGGDSQWPGDGEDGVPGGTPGNAGNGGVLYAVSELPNSILLSLGGSAGAVAPTTIGGQGGTPRSAVHILGFCNVFSCATRASSDGSPTNSPRAQTLVGQPGSKVSTGNPFSWMSPAALRMILAHARDAYINGHMDFAESALADYRDLILAYEAEPEWQNLPSITQMELFQLFDEITEILQRIGSNLDYFGNPAGWVPMLSFEVNRAIFDNEIDRAIRVLYLTYWLGNAAANLQARVSALQTARQELQAQIADLTEDYTAANELIPALNVEAANIESQIALLQDKLILKEQQLLAQAQANLRGPSWKRALRIIGTIAKLVPVAQPYLAAVGFGLDLITNINPDQPLAAIQQIQGTVETYQNERNGFTQAAGDFQRALQNIDFHDIPTAIRTLKAAAGPISSTVNKIRAALKDTQIPQDRLQAELQRLKAGDPVFKELVDEVDSLMVQKRLFGEQLAMLVQNLSNYSNDISASLLAMDALNRDLSQGNAALDDRVSQYLDQMERRARHRLLKYHYLMAKAFEYRMLQPYTANLNLNTMFDLMRNIADAANSNENLSQSDFIALKGLYEEQLSSLAEQIFDLYNANAPARTTGIRFFLEESELDALNTGEAVVINLKDRGLFSLDEEDIRIVNIGVQAIQTHYDGPAPTGFAVLDVDMTHSGESRITRNGQTYAFRHFTGTTESPLIWSSRYDAFDHQVSNQPVSPAEESLLRSLLGSPTSEDLLLFSRPGGWSDIVLTKAVNTSNGSDIVIDSLRLELSFDFRMRPGNMRFLEVDTSEPGFLPYIETNRADQNGRQDGRGRFHRAYPRNTAVTLAAAPTYGQWAFDRWTDEDGGDFNPPATDPSLTLVVGADTSVIAKYIRTCTNDFEGDGRLDGLDIPGFLAVLAGEDSDPARACGADVDGNGLVDAADVQPFVSSLLSPVP